jgi:hypothetical protein
MSGLSKGLFDLSLIVPPIVFANCKYYAEITLSDNLRDVGLRRTETTTKKSPVEGWGIPGLNQKFY